MFDGTWDEIYVLSISYILTSITNMQRLNGIVQTDCDFEYLFRKSLFSNKYLFFLGYHISYWLKLS